MAGDQEFFIPEKAQSNLLEWCKKTLLTTGTVHDGFNHRHALEAIDKEYYRDNIYTEDKISAALKNREGDKKKLQDIVVPLVEAQTETTLAYLTSVFLTGNPIFGVTAGVNEIDSAKQFQAVISENSIRGGWVRQLLLTMHDSLKYFGVAEVCWDKEEVPTFEPNFDQTTGARQEIKNVIWQGNRLTRVSPYNSFWDHRVPLTEVHTRAEYAGYVTQESRVTLKQYIESRGIKMNVAKAYEAEAPSANQQLFYIPRFMWNSLDQLDTSGTSRGVVTDFSNFEVPGRNGKTRVFKNVYYKVTRYVRLVPADFGMQVPKANQIQIWKIVTVNDQVLIEAQRQNNIHALIPLIFTQPTEDGLSFTNRSFAQKQIPIADIGSALLNGALQARRRAVSDRLVYDPSRITAANIASDSPSARIPVRPTAYGSDISKAVYKIPYEDHETQSFMQVAKEIMQFGDMISGQNKAQQGQFVKGNKTQHEYEDVQSHSSGRQRKLALMLEAQLFQPIKEIIKANILQYQPSGQTYLDYTTTQPIKVDPLALRKAILAYTITDGLLPEDKVANAETIQVALQTIGASPLLQSQFDLGKLFAFLMKIENADIEQFRLQPQQQQAQLQQMQQIGQLPSPAATPPGVGAA